MIHEPWLVLLSIAMAIQGSYVGLKLATGVKGAKGARRRLLLAGSALSLAVGIWSMHFVGMLAASLPYGTDFLVLPTLISFLTCVIVVGIGVSAMNILRPLWVCIAIGALAMGGGICLMHYIGMNALQGGAFLDYSLASTILAFLIAVVTSSIALWMLNRTTKPLPVWLAAVVLGIAVSGMHYTAMAGTSFTLINNPTSPVSSTALTRDTLAIIVACIAFFVSGGFLLSVLPDRDEGVDAETLALEATSRQNPYQAVDSEDQDFDIETSSDKSLSDAGEPNESDNRKHYPDSVPVEKGGLVRNLFMHDIRSVRANAHYTYVSDGQQEFFCKLSMTAIEAQLDPQRFIRVHRSYIVAIDHVEMVRRHGENGVIELNGAIVQRDIPVARTRLSILQKRVEERAKSLTKNDQPPFVN